MSKLKNNDLEELEEAVATNEVDPLTELEDLRKLYQELKDRGFNSIGDVENRIARLQ